MVNHVDKFTFKNIHKQENTHKKQVLEIGIINSAQHVSHQAASINVEYFINSMCYGQ